MSDDLPTPAEQKRDADLIVRACREPMTTPVAEEVRLERLVSGEEREAVVHGFRAGRAFARQEAAVLADQPRGEEERWEMLRPYLGHLGGCAIYKPVPSACDCGLVELRAALNAEENPNAR